MHPTTPLRPRLPRPRKWPVATLAVGLGLAAVGAQPAAAVPRQQDFGPTLRVGLDSTVLIGPNGELLDWGNNFYRQLAQTTSTNQNEPVTDYFTAYWLATAVSGRSEHNLAMNRDGQWYGWGANQYGQLGLGHKNNPVATAAAVGVTGQWRSIAAGRYHTLAINKSGKLYAWGRNNQGQLGTNNTTDASSPQAVQGLGTSSVWIAVSAGEDFSLALNTDGRIYAWGSNANNKLGLNNTGVTRKLTPFLIPSNNSLFVKIAAGKNSSVALKGDGTVWTWGSNSSGQLGRSTSNPTPAGAPYAIAASPFRDIAIGGDFCLAIKDNGTLWSWGANGSGQLGDNSATNRTAPVQVKVNSVYLNNYFSIGAGENFAVAMHADGTLTSWGNNSSGQLGNKTYTQSKMGKLIPKSDGLWLDGARQGMIASGTDATLMIKSDGSIWGMGDNQRGALGIPIVQPPALPEYTNPVPLEIDPARRRNWIKVVHNWQTAFGIQADGTLWTWGVYEPYLDPPPFRSTPFQLPLGGWVDVAAGTDGDFLAVNARGQLFGWGSGFDETTGTSMHLSTIPSTPIFSDKTWVSVSLGVGHAMGLAADGQLWGWGSTGEAGGALGNGDAVPWNTYPTPQKVLKPGLTDDFGWLAVSAGYGNTNALRADGTLWGWGLNWHAEAGISTGIDTAPSVPVQTRESGIGKDDYMILAKGTYFSAAITTKGVVKVWGPRDPTAWTEPELITSWIDEPAVEPSLVGAPVRALSSRGDFMTSLVTTGDIDGMGESRHDYWPGENGGQLGALELRLDFSYTGVNLIQ